MRYLISFVFVFTSVLGFASPSGYLYYKRLTTQENQITVNASSLVGFPVLVRITDNDLKQVTYGGKVRSSKGYDIIFTASDGSTLVPFQLESYDSITGSLVSWVRLPSISATANTDFYMFFGNASVTLNLGSKSTWDANYKAVYHLNTDIADWTNNAANLTNSATTNLSPGLAADGQRISSGANLNRAATAGLQITGDFTLEAWMYPYSLISGSNENIVLSSSSNNAGTSATNVNYCLSIVGSGSSTGTLVFKWQYGNNSDEIVNSTLPITNNVIGWHYIAVVRDNALKQVRFYFDGLQLGATVSFSNIPTGGTSNSFLIGKNLADPGRTIDAGFDEVRISNSIRNPEWIQAANNSYKTGSTFITYSQTYSVSPNNFCFCTVNMSGFTQIGTLNSHTYFKSNQKASWQKADSIASSLGGHLVSITSLPENTFLTLNLLLSNAWTGLNDSITEGNFVWSSGETVSYTNWGLLQPDNGGNSDYALFSSLAGFWDDQQNTQQFYVVEFDCLAATAVVANAGPDQNVCGTTATLSATALPSSAFGQWSLFSGTGNISTSNNSTSSVNGLGFGSNSFVWKVANGSCATSMDTVVLTTDTVKPLITCPADIVINNTPGLCTGKATWANPVVSDNCTGVVLSQGGGLTSGSPFPIGVTKVDYKAVDLNGNSSVCSFNVTVNDNEAPTINCPGNLTVNVDPGSCGAIVSGISPINALDNCSSFSVTYLISGATNGSGPNDASGVFFNVGTSQVRYIITDAAGLTAACNFNITVNDNAAPIFTFCPPDISLYASSGLCSATANWSPPLASDNCPGLTIVQVNGLTSGSSFPLGVSAIKYVATDANGITSTCAFTVTVLDTFAPTITSCPSNITIPAAGGTCTANVNWIAPGVSDNCAGATISQVAGPSSGSAFPLGTTTITYKAIDVANLSSLCSFTVTVIDTSKPVLTNCPVNVSVNNSPGLCNAIVTWIPPNAIDNCAGSTLTQITGLASGSSFPLGLTSISYQATDAAGNTANCGFTITVLDAENPVVSCPGNVSVTNDPGFCSAVVSGIAPMSSSDNCSVSGISYAITGATIKSGLNDASGTLFNLGASQVMYTITDGAGNTNSCSFTVNVTALSPTTADAGPNQFICSSTSLTTANTPLIGAGSWSVISGSGVFSNSVSPTTTITGLSLGANVFRWTISTSPCTSSFADVTIFVDTPPSISNAGTNQTTCSNSAFLNGNIPVIGTGNWTLVSGLGAISSPSSPSTSVSSLGLGNNLFKWSISNGSCPVSESTVTLSVDQNPSASNAGTNQTICISTATLAANTPLVGTGVWSIVSGSGTFSNASSATSTISGLNQGTTVLRWTISNGSCVPSFSDMSILVSGAPTLANAGSDQTGSATCGATFIALSANSPLGGTGNWSIVSGGAGSFSNSSSENSFFSGSPGVLYVLRWTITTLCGSSFDDVSVQINLNPSASLAGSDQTAACSINTVNLNANTPITGTGIWSISNGPAGSFLNANSPNTAFTGVPSTSQAVVYTLSWNISNLPCSSQNDEVEITFPQLAEPSNAGFDQLLICTSTTVNLSANLPLGHSGSWSIISGSGGTFSSTTNPTATFTGLPGTAYTLRWTLTRSGNGCSSSDDIQISFAQAPSIANAGSDQTNALTCGLNSLTLSANTPAVGNGSWSIISGVGGSFSNTLSPVSVFNGNPGVNYQLRWTITNAPCASSSDDVLIQFNDNPSVSNAGPDQNLCGVNSALLAAVSPGVGNGNWTIVSGAGGSFNSAINPTATFNGIIGNTYVLRWTVSNTPCPSSFDDVSITFASNPATANAGADQLICGNSTTLTANSALTGLGVWSVISGSGTFSNSNFESSLVSGLALGSNVFRWTISNATCTASFDEVTINVSNVPEIANAGPDQTNLCNVTSTVLSSNPPIGSTTASWSIVSGNGGSFSNFLSPTTTFSGLADSSYVVRWTISSVGCSDSFDDLIIQFKSSAHTANAGADQRVCENYGNLLLSATPPINATGSWSIISGSGSFTNSNAANTGVSGLSLGINEYKWNLVNSCGSISDTVSILVDALPSASNAGADQSFCSSTNVTTLAANSATIGVGAWTFANGSGNIANSNASNSSVSNLSSGANTLVWSISNGVCSLSSDSITLFLESLPSIALAGNDTSICNNQLALLANTPNVGIGSWSTISGSGTILDSTSSITSVSGLASGLNSFVWKISNGSCLPSRDTITINVVANPSASLAGANQVICVDSTLLSGNTPLVGSGVWSLVSGTGNIVNPSSPTSLVNSLGIGNSVFQWTISNGICPADSSQITVLVNAPTSTAFAGIDDTICGNSTTLNANPVVTGVGTWSLVSGAGSIVNTGSPSTLVNGLGLGVTIFEWKISSANCFDTFDSVSITVTSIPAIANAGADQVNLCGLLSTTLSADTANQANGSWSIVSGGGGSFSAVTSPSSTFSGLPDSSYILRWTITDLICSSSSDDVLIRFDSPPTNANAGFDKIDASTCGLTTLNLAANSPAVGSTSWSIISGVGGSISSNSPTASFSGIAGNSYALEWSISTSCGASKDTVLITFNEFPSLANAGVDQNICESTGTIQLNASMVSIGRGVWTVSSGSGIFSDSSSVGSSLSALSIGNNSFVWSVSNGVCAMSSDTVNIVVGAMPTTANAGLDQTICVDAPVISLNGNIVGAGAGQWTSLAPGVSFSNNTDPQSSVNGLATGLSTFVWSISNDLQCPVSRDTVHIFVSPFPSVANAGIDQTVCETTNSINLAASTAIVGNGLWTVSSGTAAFLASSYENTSVGNLSVGQNSLVWTISSGACTASSDTMLVLVSAIPSPALAGQNQQLCESTDTITLVGNNPLIGSGIWSLVSGQANIVSNTNDTTIITAFIPSTIDITWTITNGACSTQDTVELQIDALPTQANAGNDKSVCNPYALLKADTAYVGTGFWTVASGSTGTLLHPGFDTTAVVGMSIGQNTFIWTVSNGVCTSSVDSTIITVNPAASIANAGPDQTICESETQAFLNANVPSNGVGYWKQILGSGSIADTSAAATSVSGLAIGINIFSWIIKYGTCSSFDNVKITVNAIPTSANAGTNQTICENTNLINLSANNALVGQGVWTGPGLITDSTAQNTAATGFALGTNSYVWTISNGACLGISDTVLVFVDAMPSAAIAGSNQTHCINETGISLSADSALIGNGLWTNSGSAVVANTSLHNTSVNNLSSGLNTFIWSVSNGVCPVTSDTITIQIDELPTTSLAGPDQIVCDTFSVLTANQAALGTGNWTVTIGSGLVANSSLETSTVSGLTIGLNELVWSIANGACTASNDTLRITVLAQASQANAGTNQSVCITNPINSLFAVVPSTGSGVWSSFTAGVVINNPPLPNSTVSNLALGINSFVWTVSNGLCAETKDTVTILLSDSPSPSLVGANQTICENAVSVSINANSALIGTGQWSTLQGGGSVLNPLSYLSTVTVSKGVNSFVWTISNGACPVSKDTAFVIVDSLPPLSNAGNNQSLCENTSSVSLNATAISFGSASWTSLSPGVTITSPTVNNSTVTGLSLGQNSFVWTTINGVCPSSFDTTIISIDAVPTSSYAGVDQTLCDTTATTVLHGNEASVGLGIWLPILGAGNLSQPSDSNTAVTGLVPGLATFEWVITNGSCLSSRDTVSVLVSSSPSTSDAGADQTVCENIGTILLNAVVPTIGIGAWSLDNGTAIINSINLPNTTVSDLGVGANVFRWTVTNGSCKTVSTITVFVDALPSTADAGQDISVVAPITSLSATPPLSGNGLWSVSQGLGTVDNPNSNSATITNLSIGTTVLTWTVTNGSCPSSTDEVQITYLDLQIPNAISPNNDGINDVFAIPGLDFYPDAQLTIYNSWGNIVYHSNNYKNDFNGNNDSGQPLLDDTYYYVLQISTELEYKGYLIIKK